MLTNGTPIERYKLNGRIVYVKREDLSCPLPGPPFSKMRGVIEHIANRPEKVFGVLDTYHSKAGWAVAYACKKLRRKCINFYPVYKGDVADAIREPQVQSKRLGAKLYALPAGRSFILYNRARTLLQQESAGAYLMPNALKLTESVEATTAEVRVSKTALRRIAPTDVVVSVSSATIAAGVIAGLQSLDLKPRIWLHEGYSREPGTILKYLASRLATVPKNIEIIDELYAYKDTAPASCVAPFPCNPWYDLKAWNWLGTTNEKFKGNVLFWNVGN